jgi:hypothetical protein
VDRLRTDQSSAHHTQTDGRLMEPERGAVEQLNIIRPTVAVSWFVAFAGYALHRWPQHRAELRSGDLAYTVAFAHYLRRFYSFAPFVGRAGTGPDHLPLRNGPTRSHSFEADRAVSFHRVVSSRNRRAGSDRG